MKMRSVGIFLVALMLVGSACMSAQTVIRFASYGNAGAPIESLQAIADAFNATHPHIKVEVEYYPQNEYIDKITTMVMAGTPPDVLLTWAQYKTFWAEQGLILDLSERWNQSEVTRSAEIYPFVLDSAMVDGRIYGIPYGYSTQVWFYNRDWFAERGLLEPEENWTVDEHAEMARKLTDPQRGVYGTLNPVKLGRYESIQWMENWSGTGWLSADGSTVTVNHPDNLDMVQYWIDLERQYEAAPYPGSFPIRSDRVGGGYAMWTGWISNAFTNPPTYDWGWALYPAGPAGQKNFAQTHIWSISSGSKHADEAWEFIEWMASYEGQKAVVQGAERHPIGPDPELWDLYLGSVDPAQAAYMYQFMASTLYGKNYAKSFEYWPTYGQMESIMQLHMANIFTRQRPAASELEEAARKMQAILRSNN